jgi:4-hydroxybenzoate polyprenyltransferase
MKTNNFTNKVIQYSLLARLHRPIGILLLMWPTLWALWLAAGGLPATKLLVIFLLGTIIMRSAGCIINDYLDRNYDGAVKRTQNRPLVTGKVSSREALALFTVLLFCAEILVFLTNDLTVILAFVGAFLAVTYPLAKRFTYLPQIHLGAAFGWAIPMVFAAQNGHLPPETWLVFCATLLWALVYDTEYAMVDRADDLQIGVKSTAILFGENDRLMIGYIQLMFLLNLALIGNRWSLDWPYYVSILATAGLFLRQQYLIRNREPKACFAAFKNNNLVGLSIFIGISSSEITPPFL